MNVLYGARCVEGERIAMSRLAFSPVTPPLKRQYCISCAHARRAHQQLIHTGMHHHDSRCLISELGSRLCLAKSPLQRVWRSTSARLRQTASSSSVPPASARLIARRCLYRPSHPPSSHPRTDHHWRRPAHLGRAVCPPSTCHHRHHHSTSSICPARAFYLTATSRRTSPRTVLSTPQGRSGIPRGPRARHLSTGRCTAEATRQQQLQR